MSSWFLALAGCGWLSGACVGLGFPEEGCVEPLSPVPGAWRAAPDARVSSCDVDLIALREGWALDTSDGGFSLATPASGDPVGCDLGDDGAFACDAAPGPSGATVAVEGVFTSRSTADVTLALVRDACAAEVPATFEAAWKSDAALGECPDDFDRFDVDSGEPSVTVTVENRSSASLGLYALTGGSGVFLTPLDAGAVVDTVAYLGQWLVIGTGSDEDACVWAFQVSAEDQYEVYSGE